MGTREADECIRSDTPEPREEAGPQAVPRSIPCSRSCRPFPGSGSGLADLGTRTLRLRCPRRAGGRRDSVTLFLLQEVMDTFKSRVAKLEALQQVTQLEVTESVRSRPRGCLCRWARRCSRWPPSSGSWSPARAPAQCRC